MLFNFSCVNQRTKHSIELTNTWVEQNNKLNDTYIGYGAIGSKRKEMQLVQDDEASSFSSSNMTERVLSKSSRAYSNASWDILDLYNEDKDAVLKLEDEQLPEGLKGKSKKEKIDYNKYGVPKRVKI